MRLFCPKRKRQVRPESLLLWYKTEKILVEVSKVEYEEIIWDRTTIYNAFLYERHKWGMWFRLRIWKFIGLKRKAGKWRCPVCDDEKKEKVNTTVET
jgi:hypothetical protein